jgi:drug/metabolite transporter (DMT)-like permease
VTFTAAIFFGEPVGWRCFVAIGIGFVGVTIIIRPGLTALASIHGVAAGCNISRSCVTQTFQDNSV